MTAIGDIYQATYQSSIQGQTIENVIHFRGVAATETDGDVDTAVKLFGHYLCNLHVTTQIQTGIIVKKMTPIPFDERLVIPTDATGQQSAAALNQTVALVFTKRTGVSGKSHRGRIYVSAVPSNMSSDQCRLNVTGAGIAGTFVSQVIAAFGPSGSNGHLQFGVYSGAIGGLHPFTVAGWQPVTSMDPQIIFGNQRRRRVGVGI